MPHQAEDLPSHSFWHVCHALSAANSASSPWRTTFAYVARVFHLDSTAQDFMGEKLILKKNE